MSGEDRSGGSSSPRVYRCADGSWRPSRPEGIARVLAKAGYGARPRTETMVRAGRITVDGKVELDPGRPVDRANELRLDGKVLREVRRRYVVLHKPAGIDCQERRHAGLWIGDYLSDDAEGLEPAGRLDTRSRGLLLVSNDLAWNAAVAGDQNLERRYAVLVSGTVSPQAVDVLRSGMTLPGQGVFRARSVDVQTTDAERTRLVLRVRGGHQRQIRAVFLLLRHSMLSCVRTGLGPVDLAGLAAGASRDLKPGEIQRLAVSLRKI